MTEPSAGIEANGFVLVQSLLATDVINELRATLANLTVGQRGHGSRNLLTSSATVRAVASSPELRRLFAPILGPDPFPIRAILFDKLAGANWGVGWHQDLTVAVAERIDAPGFGAWTVKDGVPHAQPPVQVLENMLILRLHLDVANGENGALIVLPGSHRHGRLPEPAIAGLVSQSEPMVCEANPGDVLAFRPLLLHMSRPSVRPSHRRVVQIEYAGVELPPPLAWREPQLPAQRRKTAVNSTWGDQTN